MLKVIRLLMPCAVRAFTSLDSSRRSQSGQEGADDHGHADEDQEGRGLKEMGGAL